MRFWAPAAHTYRTEQIATTLKSFVLEGIAIERSGMPSFEPINLSPLVARVIGVFDRDAVVDAKRETLLISVSLEAYLFGALRYSIYNLIRSRKIREAYLEHLLRVPGDENNYIEDRLHYEELARALESSVQNLPEKLRKVYLLSRKEHLTYKEIAEQEQIPVDTVEKQMGRALKILRENLKEFAWAWIVLEMWDLYP